MISNDQTNKRSIPHNVKRSRTCAIACAALILTSFALSLSGCSKWVKGGTPAWVGDFEIDPASVQPLRMNKHFPIPEFPVGIGDATVYLELDAGTPHGLMLTNAAAKDIRYKVIERVRELNADGSDRGADSLRVIFDTVSVLGETSAKVRGTVADWKIYSSFPFEGTVSLEMLGAKSVVLDYKKRRFALSDRPIPGDLSAALYAQAAALEIPWNYGSNVYFYGSIEGKEIVVYLDTGSSESTLDPSFAAATGPKQTVSFEVGGHGFTMKNIRVGKIRPGVNFDKPVALVLGADFLKDRILAIDRTGAMKIIIGDSK